MHPDTRVVIVDYDGEEVLPGCIESLLRTVPPGTPVTVLDNASPHPTQLLLSEELQAKLEIERLGANVGYAGAIAEAWKIGDEPFLIIANNDIRFLPGWFERLRACAESADAASAVIEHEGESDLEKSTNASLNPLLYLIPGVFKDRTKAVYPSGACFILKRDREILAPVDPFYFLYYEDVYIGFLLRALGKTVVQCPDSKVGHVGSHAVKRANTSRVAFLQERNRLITQILFFDNSTLWKLSPLIFFDSLLKIPQCLARHKPVWATVSAHFWILGNLRLVLDKREMLWSISGFNSKLILPYLTAKVLPPSALGAGFWNAMSKWWLKIMGLPVDREASDV